MRASDKTKSKDKQHDLITLWLKKQLLDLNTMTFNVPVELEMEHKPRGRNMWFDLSAFSYSYEANPFVLKSKVKVLNYQMNFEIKTGPSYSEAVRQIKFYNHNLGSRWCVCAPYDDIWMNLADVGIWYIPYNPDNLLSVKMYPPRNTNSTQNTGEI